MNIHSVTSEARQPLLRDADAPRRESDTSFAWSDARLLGYTPMDRVHEEFYASAFALVACTEETAFAALEAFEQHAIDHFHQEDDWMVSTDFPPRDCHMHEHAAMLATISEVKARLADGSGGVQLVQDFGIYLFQWFPGHADYLDSALATWMTKRTLGGTPVVLRRRT